MVGAAVAILLVAMVIAVVVGGLTTTRDVLRAFSYWVIDDRKIGVVVLDGRPNSVCAIERVDESAEAVQVWATCPEPWISTGSTGSLYRHEFEVDLQAELGDRKVIDGDGRNAESCASLCP